MKVAARLRPPRLRLRSSGPRGGLQAHRPPHGQFRRPGYRAGGGRSRRRRSRGARRTRPGRHGRRQGLRLFGQAAGRNQAGDPPRRQHGVRAHRAARHERQPVRLHPLRAPGRDRCRAEDRDAQDRGFERRHGGDRRPGRDDRRQLGRPDAAATSPATSRSRTAPARSRSSASAAGCACKDSSGDVDVNDVRGDVVVDVDSSGDLDIRRVTGGVHIRERQLGRHRDPRRQARRDHR